MNWSARPVNAQQNSNAGTQLSVLYGDERILDGDPFAVNIHS
jgi:hypothetical protein